MFGFLNIYKPSGITSFDVIAILRKVTGIRQIGHTGTLDPFASGVLLVCIGKSTKLIEYLSDDKEYIATVQFGYDTDTYDLDGEIVKSYVNKVKKEQLEELLNLFHGEIEQYPPKYSAIKINGKKLYEYARNNQDVEIKPRKVNIFKIGLLDFDEEKQSAKIIVACSKGTYIRSIAYDLGQKMNCGGYLTALERTKAGTFSMDNSIDLKKLKSITDVENCLINPLDVLQQEKYELNILEKERVLHGMSIKAADNYLNIMENNVVFLTYSGKMVAVGMREGNEIKIKKVFEEL